MKPLSRPYQLMLLAAIVLAVFYPTLFAEVSLIDDTNAVTALLNTDRFSFIEIFIPRLSGGGYYRPLIVLSYWFDKWFWFLEGGLMHFECIVAHLCNAILVYFITLELVSPHERRTSHLPLLAGLLFAVSPIVTESVNWISGRTDIMMGNIVLLSLLLLLKYRSTRQRYLIVFSIVLAFVSLLAKEAAFGFLIGMPLLLTCHDHGGAKTPSAVKIKLYGFMACFAVAFLSALFFDNYWLSPAMAIVFFVLLVRIESIENDTGGVRQHHVFLAVAGLLTTAALFYLIRRLVFVSDVDKIGQTVRLMFTDMNYSISLFLGAAGFYVKKFFIPQPLNFFIVEIDPLYDFLGIMVLLGVVYLLKVRTMPAVITLLGFFMLLPALPFVFGTIAWTAYAERYIYLSSAFWWITICIALAPRITLCGHPARKAIAVAVCLFIAATACASYARNMVWQTNTGLLKNTVEQNPANRMLRDVYLSALIDTGNIDEAKKQYSIAAQLPQGFRSNRYDDRGDLIMAQQYSKENNHFMALQIYQQALVKTKYGSEALLAGAVSEIDTLLRSSLPGDEQRRLEALKSDYSGRLKRLTENPHRLLEYGKDALRRGSFQEAAQFFDRAGRGLPPDHRLRPVVSSYLLQTNKP